MGKNSQKKIVKKIEKMLAIKNERPRVIIEELNKAIPFINAIEDKSEDVCVAIAKFYSCLAEEYLKISYVDSAYENIRHACQELGCVFFLHDDYKDYLSRLNVTEVITSDMHAKVIMSYARICNEKGDRDKAKYILDFCSSYSDLSRVHLADVLFDDLLESFFDTGNFYEEEANRINVLLDMSIENLSKSRGADARGALLFAYRKKADLSFFSGKNNEAVNLLNSAIDLESGSCYALHRMAQFHLQEGEYDAYFSALSKISKKNSSVRLSEKVSGDLKLLKNYYVRGAEQRNSYFVGPSTCSRLCANASLNIPLGNALSAWSRIDGDFHYEARRKSLQKTISRVYRSAVYKKGDALVVVHQFLNDEDEKDKEFLVQKIGLTWFESTKPLLEHLHHEYGSCNITHTGYGFGAALAEVSAAGFSKPAITFESPGYLAVVDFLSTQGVFPKTYNNNILSYVSNFDEVKRLEGHLGEVFKIELVSSTLDCQSRKRITKHEDMLKRMMLSFNPKTDDAFLKEKRESRKGFLPGKSLEEKIFQCKSPEPLSRGGGRRIPSPVRRWPEFNFNNSSLRNVSFYINYYHSGERKMPISKPIQPLTKLSTLAFKGEQAYAWNSKKLDGGNDSLFQAIASQTHIIKPDLNRELLIENLRTLASQQEIREAFARSIQDFFYLSYGMAEGRFSCQEENAYREEIMQASGNFLKLHPEVMQIFHQIKALEKKLHIFDLQADSVHEKREDLTKRHAEFLQELKNYCSSKVVFTEYINMYFEQLKGPVPFYPDSFGKQNATKQPLDIMAKILNVPIFVWQKDSSATLPYCLNEKKAGKAEAAINIHYQGEGRFSRVSLTSYAAEKQSQQGKLDLAQLKMPYAEPYDTVNSLLTYYQKIPRERSENIARSRFQQTILFPFIKELPITEKNLDVLLAIAMLEDDLMRAVVEKVFSNTRTDKNPDPAFSYELLVKILFHASLSKNNNLTKPTIISLAKKLCQHLCDNARDLGSTLDTGSINATQGLAYALDLLVEMPVVGKTICDTIAAIIDKQTSNALAHQRQYPMYFAMLQKSAKQHKRLQPQETPVEMQERHLLGFKALGKGASSAVEGVVAGTTGVGLLAAAIAASVAGLGAPVLLLPGAIVSFITSSTLAALCTADVVKQCYKAYSYFSPLSTGLTSELFEAKAAMDASNQFWTILLLSFQQYKLKENITGKDRLAVIAYLTDMLLTMPTTPSESQLKEVLGYFKAYYANDGSYPTVNCFIVASMLRLREAGYDAVPALNVSKQDSNKVNQHHLRVYERFFSGTNKNTQQPLNYYWKNIRNQQPSKKARDKWTLKLQTANITKDDVRKMAVRRASLQCTLEYCLKARDKANSSAVRTVSYQDKGCYGRLKSLWGQCFPNDEAVFALSMRYDSAVKQRQLHDEGARLYKALHDEVLSFLHTAKSKFSAEGRKLALYLETLLLPYKKSNNSYADIQQGMVHVGPGTTIEGCEFNETSAPVPINVQTMGDILQQANEARRHDELERQSQRLPYRPLMTTAGEGSRITNTEFNRFKFSPVIRTQSAPAVAAVVASYSPRDNNKPGYKIVVDYVKPYMTAEIAEGLSEHLMKNYQLQQIKDSRVFNSQGYIESIEYDFSEDHVKALVAKLNEHAKFAHATPALENARKSLVP